MKILHAITSINPIMGGPVEGIKQRGNYLSAIGHCVEVVSSDKMNADYVSNFPLPLHLPGGERERNFSPFSYSFNWAFYRWLREHASDYNFIVVNGLWQFQGLAVWLALLGSKTPYVVFVHGMLDPWFKANYRFKHIKKLIYWLLIERRVLRNAGYVLFTSEEECLAARRSFPFYRVNERVVDYGTNSPDKVSEEAVKALTARHPIFRKENAILFVGRIHPKKGVDVLIAAFSQACKLDNSAHLIIAGPDQDNYEKELRDLSRKFNIEAKVSFIGMIQGEEKCAAYSKASVFALASHQENFGISVAEALAVGKPVLISNKVNIWREIENDGAGLVGEDTVYGFRILLERWLTMDVAAKRAMSIAAGECFRRRFSVERMAESLIDVGNALKLIPKR